MTRLVYWDLSGGDAKESSRGGHHCVEGWDWEKEHGL